MRYTTAAEIPEVFREAIAVHMILIAGCGVVAADITVQPNALAPDGTAGQLGVLAQQGDFQFLVTVGPLRMSDSDFLDQWPAAIRFLKTMTDVEAYELRDRTNIRHQAVQIIATYLLKKRAHAR